MKYSNLSEQWKLCFEHSVRAFRRGALPIGVVVYDAQGKEVAVNRNKMIYGSLSSNMTQHAEIETLAMITLPRLEQRLTMYGMVEPCPMCFGAINVARIAELHYATRDPWAGSTDLAGMNWYMKRKTIEIVHEGGELEKIMACFVVYSMMKEPGKLGLHDLNNELVDRWALVVPDVKDIVQRMVFLQLETFTGGYAEFFDMIATCILEAPMGMNKAYVGA